VTVRCNQINFTAPNPFQKVIPSTRLESAFVPVAFSARLRYLVVCACMCGCRYFTSTIPPISSCTAWPGGVFDWRCGACAGVARPSSIGFPPIPRWRTWPPLPSLVTVPVRQRNIAWGTATRGARRPSSINSYRLDSCRVTRVQMRSTGSRRRQYC